LNRLRADDGCHARQEDCQRRDAWPDLLATNTDGSRRQRCGAALEKRQVHAVNEACNRFSEDRLYPLAFPFVRADVQIPNIPWQLTGNHWLSLPCINPADGA